MRSSFVILWFVVILALVSLATLAIFVLVPSTGPFLLGAPQQLWSPTSDVIGAVIGIPTALAGSIVAIYLAYHALRVSNRQGDLMAMGVIQHEIGIVKDDVSNAELHLISLARATLRYASSIRDFVEASVSSEMNDNASVSELVDEVEKGIKNKFIVDGELESAYLEFKERWDECLHRSAELACRAALSSADAHTTPEDYEQLEKDQEELERLNVTLNELSADFASKIHVRSGFPDDLRERIEELLDQKAANWLRVLRSEVDRLKVEKNNVCSAEKDFHEAKDELIEFLLSRSRSPIFQEIVAHNLSSEIFRGRFEKVLKSASTGARIRFANSESELAGIGIYEGPREYFRHKFDRQNLMDVLAKLKEFCSGPAIVDSWYAGRLIHSDLSLEEEDASWHFFNRGDFFARSLPAASKWLPRPGAVWAKQVSQELYEARKSLIAYGINFPAVVDVPYPDLRIVASWLGESEITIGKPEFQNRSSSGEMSGASVAKSVYPDHVKCTTEKALEAINSSSFIDVFSLLATLCDLSAARDRVLEYCKRFNLSQDLLDIISVDYSESGIREQLDFPLVLGMALGQLHFKEDKDDVESKSAFELGREREYENNSFLEVIGIARDGAAAKAGLEVGDVILGFGQGADKRRSSDYSQFLREVRHAKEQGKRKMKLRIRRRSESKTTPKETVVQIII